MYFPFGAFRKVILLFYCAAAWVSKPIRLLKNKNLVVSCYWFMLCINVFISLIRHTAPSAIRTIITIVHNPCCNANLADSITTPPFFFCFSFCAPSAIAVKLSRKVRVYKSIVSYICSISRTSQIFNVIFTKS